MIRLHDRTWRRLASAVCAAGLLAFLPLVAHAEPGVTPWDYGDDGAEGDPIDSNDFNGGMGDGHDDIHDSSSTVPDGTRLPGLDLGKWILVLVPGGTFGVTVYSFVVVERPAAVEGAWYAQ